LTHSDIEVEPIAASALAGNRIEPLRAFTRDLAERGEELGLIGPLERPRIWTRHVLNSALVAPLLKPGTLADVGSGAGLPGLVLAILRTDVHCTLIEPMERRVQWLNEQVERLGLENVRVIRARAEDVQGTERFDQVTARAVSALKKLIPMTAPLVRPSGELVFMKGERVHEEIAAATTVIRKFKLSDVRVDILHADGLTEQTRVFRATVESGSA
jgi:16S rRNA (guanine527-N7)-methyltransferase